MPSECEMVCGNQGRKGFLRLLQLPLAVKPAETHRAVFAKDIVSLIRWI